MRTLIFTSLSGWVLLALVAFTTMLPYLLRIGTGRLTDGTRSFTYDLRPHYWLAYAIALISFAHVWIPMSAGSARRLNATGLYAATGGWFLIFIQIVLGRSLRSSRQNRSWLRR